MTRTLIAAVVAVCVVSTADAAMNRIEKSEQLKKIHKCPSGEFLNQVNQL